MKYGHTDADSGTDSRQGADSAEEADPLPWLIRSLQRKQREEAKISSDRKPPSDKDQ